MPSVTGFAFAAAFDAFASAGKGAQHTVTMPRMQDIEATDTEKETGLRPDFTVRPEIRLEGISGLVKTGTRERRPNKAAATIRGTLHGAPCQVLPDRSGPENCPAPAAPDRHPDRQADKQANKQDCVPPAKTVSLSTHVPS
ncbi:MAG: hypothetical protein ABF917_10480 [Gluconobacter oxydans]|uniref:hypothetical protein n=1 Tax=Gluconobacter oxydans TaxID=442 RepID=UPI0039E7FE75